MKRNPRRNGQKFQARCNERSYFLFPLGLWHLCYVELQPSLAGLKSCPDEEKGRDETLLFSVGGRSAVAGDTAALAACSHLNSAGGERSVPMLSGLIRRTKAGKERNLRKRTNR